MFIYNYARIKQKSGAIMFFTLLIDIIPSKTRIIVFFICYYINLLFTILQAIILQQLIVKTAKICFYILISCHTLVLVPMMLLIRWGGGMGLVRNVF